MAEDKTRRFENEQAYREWQAWQSVVDEICLSAGTDREAFNSVKWTNAVAALRLWGEELVTLRMEQDVGTVSVARQKAREDWRQVVEDE